MKVLGIYWAGPATAALLVDGRVVACVSEERFSRRKNDDIYPRRAIEAVLAEGGVRPEELDHVAFAGERFDLLIVLCHKMSAYSVRDRLREQREYWRPKLIEKRAVSYVDLFADKLDTAQYPGDWAEVVSFFKSGKDGDVNAYNAFSQQFRKDVIRRHLGIDASKVIFPHHHRCHGYYAYYGSPMKKDKTVILTADAWGDDMNASVSLAEGGDIRLLSSSANFIVGRLYRNITLLLGMKPDEHEYKVMGLAPYAKSKYCQEPLAIFRNTMYVDGLGFKYKEVPSDLYYYFKERLEGYRFDAIAGALQQYTQDILVEWAQNALKATGAKRIAFGGGVAMNIKAVLEMAKIPGAEEIFLCPAPSDESLAIGATYVAMHDVYRAQGIDPASRLQPLASAYLGPATSPAEVRAVVENAKKKGYMVRERPSADDAAERLAQGKIIGRCVGRSEFGARSLGNRSILADPRQAEVIKTINEKIKSRDFWMPFAPSLLEEEADRYLENPKRLRAPFMTMGFETKPASWKDLKAASHPYDQTVRPQIVSRATNPEYHALLSAFHAKTGVGGVLNTSFNVHGEPIVQTPQDAFDVFERTDLDALLLDGCLIERKT